MSAFLIEAFDWSVDMAVNSFIAARTPGSTFLKLKIQIFSNLQKKIMPCAKELEKYVFECRKLFFYFISPLMLKKFLL